MRTRSPLTSTIAAIVGVASLAAAAPALAAPPPNDAQAAAQQLTLPADVAGTTAESTLEAIEPPAPCAGARGTVWYAFTATGDERVVVRLQANGDLDAQVSVYRRQRSQTGIVGCDNTDADGVAQVNVTTQARGSYLIRVEQRFNSVAGTFRLAVLRPQPAPRLPGTRLSPGGVSGTVDSVENTADAYSVRLTAGRSYRVNLARSRPLCTTLAVFGPGATSLEDDPVRRVPCQGYILFSPERSGTYSFLVSSAANAHVVQPYRLRVVRARADDTSPGLSLRNFARASGALAGRAADVVDLYRFDVTSRSELSLTLSARGDPDFDLLLLNDRGARIQCECGDSGGQELRRQLRSGRYFAAVRARNGARGRYSLRRVSRAITRSSIAIDGRARATAAPGRAVTVSIRVRPSVAGPVTIVLERFDPLESWQFLRRVRARATNGRATITFRPPGPGRYRARATFAGTRGAASSDTGFARLLVAGPLRQ